MVDTSRIFFSQARAIIILTMCVFSSDVDFLSIGGDSQWDIRLYFAGVVGVHAFFLLRDVPLNNYFT